jgi:predicted nucleotidyltransferase
VNPIEASLRSIAEEMARQKRRWSLIGGLAVSVRAEPRTTRDVDIATAVTDDNDAESLIVTLRDRGYTVMAVLEQTATKRLATVRLTPPKEIAKGTLVDILFASSGIEPEIVAQSELLEILPGTVVPVARVGHLIALKLLARDDRHRPQDWDDLRALLVEATPQDLSLAREAVRLIELRGFSRGRNLVAALEELLESSTPHSDP